jgi:hypothetical protein
MLSRHFGKGLSEEQRARWVALMTQSARDAGLPADAEFRAAFGAYIEWGSRLVVESAQSGTGAPEDTPMPRWDWNSAAGPPHRRVAPAAPPPEPSAPLPGPEEAVSFDKHIKDLFREKDRNAMKFVFDLWNVDDVRKHAAAILESLREGSMPCDGAWPSEKTDLFDRWVNTGMP